MKICLLLLAVLVGQATAAPRPISNTSVYLPQLPDKEKLDETLDTILRNENGVLDRLQELVRQTAQRDILDIILEILHLLGYTDEEIRAFILYMIEVVQSVEEQLTYVDMIKMENAGMSIMIPVRNMQTYDWNTFLGNAYTLKDVVYPYVPAELQIFLDNLEETFIKLWRLFNN